MKQQMKQKAGQTGRTLRLSVIFLAGVFFLALLVMAPARLGQLANLPGNITVSNWKGTIWQGRADHVSLANRQGEVLLEGTVTWDVQLLSLLQGELCSLFYAQESLLSSAPDRQEVAEVRGEACWVGNNGIVVQDVSFSLPAERLLYNAEMALAGLIQGRLDSVRWQSGTDNMSASIDVDGQGQWRNIDVTVPGMTALRQVDWPDIPFTISSPDPQRLQIEAAFNREDSANQQVPANWPIHSLSVNLNVAMNGAYQTEILLLPDDGIDPQLESWLAVLAEEGLGDFAGGYRYFIRSP